MSATWWWVLIGYCLPLMIWLCFAAWEQWAARPTWPDKRDLAVAICTITAFLPAFNWYMLIRLAYTTLEEIEWKRLWSGWNEN